MRYDVFHAKNIYKAYPTKSRPLYVQGGIIYVAISPQDEMRPVVVEVRNVRLEQYTQILQIDSVNELMSTIQ